MNQHENQEQTGPAVEIEDLPVDEAQQDEVKGGTGVANHGALQNVSGANTWTI